MINESRNKKIRYHYRNEKYIKVLYVKSIILYLNLISLYINKFYKILNDNKFKNLLKLKQFYIFTQYDKI